MKIALVGASNDKEKFGNKIMKHLVSEWHNVFPINPNEVEIEWIRTHKMLKTVPKSFDIINFVVQPNITLQILKKYEKLLKNKQIIIQPGAEDEEVINFIKEWEFTNATIWECIMKKELD